MIRRSVAVVTPPAVEPVSVAELADFARIDPDAAAAEQSRLAMLIVAARTAAESYTGRHFIARTLRLSLDGHRDARPWIPGYYELPVDFFDGFLPPEIELAGPVIAVASITTYDAANAATAYADTRYGVYGDRIALNSGESWPTGLRGACGTEVVYTAGYGPNPADVPAPIRTAILLHAALLYEGGCSEECPEAGVRLLRQYRAVRL